MKTSLLVLLIAAGIATPAHELWLQSHKYFFYIREIANIRFRAGEHFDGTDRTGNREKILRLDCYMPSGKLNDISGLVSSSDSDSIRLPLREEGTYMIVLNGTDNRSAKTIIQVGGKVTDACLHPALLPLDIIPEENPYAVPMGTDSEKPVKVKFQVLFQEQPVDNVPVNIWYYDASGRVKTDSVRTNRRGWITTLRHSGPFMIGCAYTANEAENRGQTYRASLSFEYSRFFPGKSGVYLREQ